MNTANKVLLALGVFVALFITTMVVVFCVYGSTPDTLIQYTLGAGGLEVLVLAMIKVSKVVANKPSKVEEAKTDERTDEETYLA